MENNKNDILIFDEKDQLNRVMKSSSNITQPPLFSVKNSNKQLFICPACRMWFPQKYRLDQHILSAHKSEKSVLNSDLPPLANSVSSQNLNYLRPNVNIFQTNSNVTIIQDTNNNQIPYNQFPSYQKNRGV